MIEIVSLEVESKGSQFTTRATLTTTLKLRLPKGSKANLRLSDKQNGYKALVLKLYVTTPSVGRLILNTEEVTLSYTESFPGGRTKVIGWVIVKDLQNNIILHERVLWR